MCGIAGILGAGFNNAPIAEMTAALRHRGPDRQATVSLPHAQVGAARLRIVDLTSGDQPLVSARTGAVLVFNGEIYNYPDLRRDLKARGHRFETATDSEIVLRAYEEYDWRCVEVLRGMYAFAIVDGDRALLARDSLGIKPLHYCLLNGGRSLAFASEIKSLLRCAEVPARIDEATMGDLRALEYVADPRATLFEGIACLEPGRCLDIQLSGAGLNVRERQFTPRPDRGDPIEDLDAAEEHLDALLDAAVRSHQMADVPICLTLSGGLDSTLLALILRQQAGAGIVTYAAADDATHPDFPQAHRIAQSLGFEHRAVLFTFEQYLAAMAPSIAAGETFTDSVGQFLLFREIGRQFRVAINGEGADELFGGYPEHRWSDRYVARLREALPSLPLTERGAIERERLLAGPPIDDDRWMLDHFMGSQLVDRHLHPLDKISMASSVEVRVPYLDYDVAAYGGQLPAEWRVSRSLGSLKYILRRVYLRRWRSFGGGSALLDAVLREKFGFPDSRRASKARFHALCARVLPERYFAEHPRRRFLFHQTQAIWFDLFEDLFCRHRGVLPADFDVLDFIAERARKARSEVAAVAELVPAEVGLPPYAYAQPVSARVLQESAVPVSSPPQVTDADDRPTAVRESRELDPATQGVVARLCDIVRAVGGSELETNGTELWFTLPGEPRVQVRLGADPESPCYDRSANFAISYGGGRSDEPPSSAFVGAIDSMKAIDDTTMGDVPAKFSLAAAHVVERLLDGAGAQSDASPAGTPTEVPSKQPSSDYSGARWECHGTRELNVMFLDLCARLIGGGQPLTSLHWGYWSDPGAERALMEAGDHDPFEAFSLNLLAHVPESAIHILDVGCGLGANAKILASRQKVVTALSPVPHHCAAIEAARLPGVDVHCARFEELRPDRAYDLLLFSESVNHFDLRDAFFAYCATFLRPGGFLLLADDLTAERAEQIAAQRVFRLVREVDISANVAPTGQWWARHMRAFVAFRAALLELLEMRERGLAARVQEVFEGLESSDLRALFSGETAAPVSKGRYLIYLLQL